jgi:hypothetical protein
MGRSRTSLLQMSARERVLLALVVCAVLWSAVALALV